MPSNDPSWEMRKNELFMPQFLSLSLFSFCFAFSYDFTSLSWRNIESGKKYQIAKKEHKWQNICDFKWQIWHQRTVRTIENREKLISNVVNFHLSINSCEFWRLTKSFFALQEIGILCFDAGTNAIAHLVWIKFQWFIEASRNWIVLETETIRKQSSGNKSSR